MRSGDRIYIAIDNITLKIIFASHRKYNIKYFINTYEDVDNLQFWTIRDNKLDCAQKVNKEFFNE